MYIADVSTNDIVFISPGSNRTAVPDALYI